MIVRCQAGVLRHRQIGPVDLVHAVHQRQDGRESNVDLADDLLQSDWVFHWGVQTAVRRLQLAINMLRILKILFVHCGQHGGPLVDTE